MHGDSLYWKNRGILFWTDFWFKMLLTFKASLPLLANLTFRNGWFLVSVGSPTLTALKSLFEEKAKIIRWSRCPGDPTSAKCKVKVDSYKDVAVSMAETTVLYKDLTVNWRTARAHQTRHHVSQAYYISSSHGFDVSCWFCQTDSKHLPTGIQDWWDSLCCQCDHYNHMEQHFQAVVPSVLPVSDEIGYSN